MKTPLLFGFLCSIVAVADAFVVPLSFEQKCRDANAILVITVEKVEPVDLTSELRWHFKALARCKVKSSFKGGEELNGKFIFIPCDYQFDESPCEIEQGKSYVAFLETMGNFSKFGHPISAGCCHEIIDGKAHTGIPETKPVSLFEFEAKVLDVLGRATPSAKAPAGE